MNEITVNCNGLNVHNSIKGTSSLIFQGVLLTITTLAVGTILANNGTFAAALANQKAAVVTLLTVAILQSVILSIHSYKYTQKKNYEDFVKDEIASLFPNESSLVNGSKHKYTHLSNSLKSLIIEYAGGGLKIYYFLLKEFGLDDSGYLQEYVKKRLGNASWQDIQIVFTQLCLARKEKDPAGWLCSLESLDTEQNFTQFDQSWASLENYGNRVHLHLPILTHFFMDDPAKSIKNKKVEWVKSFHTYTGDLLQNGSEELMTLAFERGFIEKSWCCHFALKANEKTAVFVLRYFSIDDFFIESLSVLQIIEVYGWSKLLQELINQRWIRYGTLGLHNAIFGALLQKRTLANQKMPPYYRELHGPREHFSLNINEVMKGNYRETIRLLMLHGANAYHKDLGDHSPLSLARQHGLDDLIPLLEGNNLHQPL